MGSSDAPLNYASRRVNQPIARMKGLRIGGMVGSRAARGQDIGAEIGNADGTKLPFFIKLLLRSIGAVIIAEGVMNEQQQIKIIVRSLRMDLDRVNIPLTAGKAHVTFYLAKKR